MLTELCCMVRDSKIRGLKLTVEVAAGGEFSSRLEDRNGQRGSAFGGTIKPGAAADDFNTLEGHARQLVLQEARRSLKAER